MSAMSLACVPSGLASSSASAHVLSSWIFYCSLLVRYKRKNKTYGQPHEPHDKTHEYISSVLTEGWEPEKGIGFSQRACCCSWLASPLCPGKSASPYGHAYASDAAHGRNRDDERDADPFLDTARLARDGSACGWFYRLSHAEQETNTLDAPVQQRIGPLHCWDDHLVHRDVWLLTRESNTRHKHKKLPDLVGKPNEATTPLMLASFM